MAANSGSLTLADRCAKAASITVTLLFYGLGKGCVAISYRGGLSCGENLWWALAPFSIGASVLLLLLAIHGLVLLAFLRLQRTRLVACLCLLASMA